MRLADEYDAAQERGKFSSRGRKILEATIFIAADIGLRHDEIHEARQLRDAETIVPGTAEHALMDMIHGGREPKRSQI